MCAGERAWTQSAIIEARQFFDHALDSEAVLVEFVWSGVLELTEFPVQFDSPEKLFAGLGRDDKPWGDREVDSVSTRGDPLPLLLSVLKKFLHLKPPAI